MQRRASLGPCRIIKPLLTVPSTGEKYTYQKTLEEQELII